MVSKVLDNKTVLVTGSSRGVGAELAKIVANLGAKVVVNYRNKAVRAHKVVDEIVADGGQAILCGADLTDKISVANMLVNVKHSFDKLDVLVLNASGGMESGMSADYALQLNKDAQINLLNSALEIMPDGSRVIFVTSHQAHFIKVEKTLPEYEVVAKSKRAGEDALRKLLPKLELRNIKLVVVSGDMIEGTVTAMLLNRNNPGILETRKQEIGKLLSVKEFAENIAEMCVAPVVNGYTKYAGGRKGYEQYEEQK